MERARAASEADLGFLAESSAALVATTLAQRGGALWAATVGPRPPFDAAHRARIADPDAFTFVGTVDGVPLGHAAGGTQLLDDGRLLARVDEIFVDPVARAVGIGECLVDEIVAWADAHGCVGIDATALPGDRATKNFFEGHGFVARALTMHRPLQRP